MDSARATSSDVHWGYYNGEPLIGSADAFDDDREMPDDLPDEDFHIPGMAE